MIKCNTFRTEIRADLITQRSKKRDWLHLVAGVVFRLEWAKKITSICRRIENTFSFMLLVSGDMFYPRGSSGRRVMS